MDESQNKTAIVKLDRPICRLRFNRLSGREREKCLKAQRGSFYFLFFFADADDDVFRFFHSPLLISNVPRMTNGWLGSFSYCCYSFVYLYEMDSSPRKKKKKKKKKKENL